MQTVKILEKIIEELDKGIWSQETINAVIAAKQQKRMDKNATLNCFTFDINQESKLDSILSLLSNKIQQLNDGEKLRFQLAVKCDTHWTAVDIELAKDAV